MIELRLFYLSTPFLISPKGERLPRFQSFPSANSELTPSPLGVVPIAIGREGGQALREK
jgi:hypothetical protein